MRFDPNTTVNHLCTEGMKLEAEGRTEEARALFRRAWDVSHTDFEKFTAAHYLGRSQDDPLDGLKWNHEALHRALRVMDESMKSHFPSLYLNLGKSYEKLGDMNRARENYQQAAQFSVHLPVGGYGDLIRTGISQGLRRSGAGYQSIFALEQLISAWCERKELKPLSLVLPAYLSNLGTEHDINKLISALSFLNASHCLDAHEHSIIRKVIAELSN